MTAITTRRFLQTVGLLFAGTLLAACGKKEAPAPAASAPAPAASVAAAPPPAKVYVVGTDAAYAPFESQNEKGEIVGMTIDMLGAVAQKAGIELKFVNTPWEGIFNSLQQGDRDLLASSITITDERKQTMDFSVPYINAGQILVVKNETQGVTTLADLAGKTVGAQIGTTGAFEIDKVAGVTKKEYDEVGLAFADLANGRIDAVVCDTPVAAQFALQSDEYKGTLKIVGEPFTDEYYGVAVKKGNKKVLDTINKGLQKVLDSGENKTIEAKWLR
jgi:polar amino acid transport system substrate-binding protein